MTLSGTPEKISPFLSLRRGGGMIKWRGKRREAPHAQFDGLSGLAGGSDL